MPIKNRNAAIAIAAVVLMAIICYSYWSLVYTPAEHNIEDNRKVADQLNQQLKLARDRAGQLNKMQAEMASLKVDVAQLEKQLPKDRELPSLIRVLTHRAEAYGLVLATVSPLRPQSKGLYDEIPYTITINSSFHSLGHFLTAMGKGERLFAARNLALTASGNSKTDPSKTVNATLTLVAFKYHE